MRKMRAVFLIFAITLVFSLALSGCGEKDYNSAKADTVNYLSENRAELEILFDGFMAQKPGFPNDSGEYEQNSYSYYQTDTTEYVTLSIDAQGMLGGQYWGLIYCPTNDLIENGQTLEIYNEQEAETGNNIFIKQKLRDSWYFYYRDYDGKVDITQIDCGDSFGISPKPLV